MPQIHLWIQYLRWSVELCSYAAVPLVPLLSHVNLAHAVADFEETLVLIVVPKKHVDIYHGKTHPIDPQFYNII